MATRNGMDHPTEPTARKEADITPLTLAARSSCRDDTNPPKGRPATSKASEGFPRSGHLVSVGYRTAQLEG
jgi:hypothetical protein